jgi:hypothetical protein
LVPHCRPLQHCVLEVHALPLGVHDSGARQTPLWQLRPEQQSPPLRQVCPDEAQVGAGGAQVPSKHRPEQQVPSLVQNAPSLAHCGCCTRHWPETQVCPEAQARHRAPCAPQAVAALPA